MIENMNIMKNLSGVFALMVMMLAASCQKGELAQPDMYTDKAVYEIAKEGGDVVVKLKATRDWTASVSPATSLDNVEGITVTPESGKASSEVVEVVISAAANESYARAAVVSFIGENISVAVTVSQEGSKERAPEKLTVAQFLAKSDDPGVWYELTGTISNLANETYGNFDLVDETGKTYVYGLTATKQGSNDKSFSTLNLKEGDILTLYGTRSSYNGVAQVGGPAYYVSHVAGAVDPAAPVKATAAEINAAEDGSTKYQLTGYVSSIQNTTYGNLYIKDATGEVYVYGIKDWANKTINVGDIITVVSSKTSHNGSPQLKNAEIKERKAVVDKTVAEFLATEESKEVYYRLTGTASGIKDGDIYGNFDIVDQSGSVYVYGLLEGWGGANKLFQNLGLKNGDTVTIVGYHTSYKGAMQVGGAFYVSHEAASGDSGEGEVNPPADTESSVYASNVALGTVSSAYTDGVAKVNGEEGVATLKLGTSKLYGEGTITVPAGTKKLTYYAVAWKDTTSELEFSVNGTVVKNQAIAANAGATSTSPYTMTVTDADKYSFDLTGIDEETKITVKTVKSGYRAIIFAVKAE